MLASFLFAGNCGRTEHGDFIYWPKIIKSYIRLGVNDFDKDLANSKVYEIEKIIRPKKAYPSGGYRVMKNIFLFHIPIKMFLTFQPKNIKLCIKEFFRTMEESI